MSYNSGRRLLSASRQQQQQQQQQQLGEWNEDWTTQQGQLAWAGLPATVHETSLADDPMFTPRSLGTGLAAVPMARMPSDRTSHSSSLGKRRFDDPIDNATAMARSVSTSIARPATHSFPQAPRPRHMSIGDHSEPLHQPAALDFSHSYTYGTSPDWRFSAPKSTSTSTTRDRRPAHDSQYTVYDPLAYVNATAEDANVALPQSAAKRPRLNVLDTSCVPLSATSLVPQPYGCPSSSSFVHALSPSTSPGLSATSFHLSQCSSTLPPSGEEMSRQTSMSSTSVLDAFDMLRVESAHSFATSASDFCTPFPFSLDEPQVQQAEQNALLIPATAPVTSFATEMPSSSSTGITTGSSGDSAPFDNMGFFAGKDSQYDQVSVSFDDLFDATSPTRSVQEVVPQGLSSSTASMQRVNSQDSNAGSASSSSTSAVAGRKSNDRRRKHIENSNKQMIASKATLQPQTKGFNSTIVESSQPGTKANKQAIAKLPYKRPKHPKLLCKLCKEKPDGYRGEHELRRHFDRAHARNRKVWVCVEPPTRETEWWPAQPLSICKHCKQGKQYNVYYNAAAHLRRTHFNPRKRGRRAKGEVRESRAGKAGGDWPDIDWLKQYGWLKEVEITTEQSWELLLAEQEQGSFDEVEDADMLPDEDQQDNFVLPDSMPSNFDLEQENLCAQTLGLAPYPLDTDGIEGLGGNTHWFQHSDLEAVPMQSSLSAPGALDMHQSSLFTTNPGQSLEFDDTTFDFSAGYPGL